MGLRPKPNPVYSFLLQIHSTIPWRPVLYAPKPSVWIRRHRSRAISLSLSFARQFVGKNAEREEERKITCHALTLNSSPRIFEQNCDITRVAHPPPPSLKLRPPLRLYWFCQTEKGTHATEIENIPCRGGLIFEQHWWSYTGFVKGETVCSLLMNKSSQLISANNIFRFPRDLSIP